MKNETVTPTLDRIKRIEDKLDELLKELPSRNRQGEAPTPPSAPGDTPQPPWKPPPAPGDTPESWNPYHWRRPGPYEWPYYSQYPPHYRYENPIVWIVPKHPRVIIDNKIRGE